jgi:putative ABC transport system substrate-binding protein
VLANPANPAHAQILKNIQAAAQKAGIKTIPLNAQTPGEIESALAAAAKEQAGAVIVGLDPLFIQQEIQIAALATKHRLPSIFSNREYAEAGGLMSYGQNQVEIYRRAAEYLEKIFKGAKPAELPVEQPTKLELLINRKTAKTLGLTIPQSLLISADKVIE